jgi:fructosamine-3-kinase
VGSAANTRLAAIADSIARQAQAEVTGLTRVSGGYINEALRADLSDGRALFVKTLADAEPGTFATEADGLEWMREAAGTCVPLVAALHDPVDTHTDTPRFLALEWIEPGHLDEDGAHQLGQGLACMHKAAAPAHGFAPGPRAHLPDGHYQPLRLGPEVVLPNVATDSWPEFYAEHRVKPLVRQLRDRGLYDDTAARVFDRLCDRLPDLSGPDEPPARLHGDLWIGNVHAGADGHPYLIDPVAHGGHREFDLSLLRLFGNPGEACFAAYDEIYPRAPGYEERETLWAIVPILWHAVLLAGAYPSQALSMARSYR